MLRRVGEEGWKGEPQCEICGCGEKGADHGPFSTYFNYTKGYRVIEELLVRGYVTLAICF